MKRFLLFTGATYYPAGGMNDLSGDFKTYEEAADKVKQDIANGDSVDWGQVFDTKKSETFSLADVIAKAKAKSDDKWEADRKKEEAEEKREEAEFEKWAKEDGYERV